MSALFNISNHYGEQQHSCSTPTSGRCELSAGCVAAVSQSFGPSLNEVACCCCLACPRSTTQPWPLLATAQGVRSCLHRQLFAFALKTRVAELPLRFAGLCWESRPDLVTRTVD
jgi:hypothetical protein